jgi:hypothetical protein
MISYMAVSISLTTWRTKIRRESNEKDILVRGIHTDGQSPLPLTPHSITRLTPRGSPDELGIRQILYIRTT